MKKILLLLTALVAILASTALAGTSPAPKPTSGVAYVGVTHSEGSDLYVAGDIKDKILGRGAIVYVTKVSSGPTPTSLTITARKVTVYTPKGSLTGTGKGTQVVNPDGTSEVRDGSFTLTTGTGALKGHSLRGKFSGPYKDGVYTFKYTGVYK